MNNHSELSGIRNNQFPVHKYWPIHRQYVSVTTRFTKSSTSRLSSQQYGQMGQFMSCVSTMQLLFLFFDIVISCLLLLIKVNF
jgi:hypothetical protein